ncbi:predicted protein [Naegleria gruberi]|uniref:Predicted protein n=1 Tax=Naegleria gruberi TaxID=5762 RepID=D2VIX1_NAEGR|nr:uncharacterized protein NAEGRDRAFT_80122 [Naegleria gruberi]EFC43175.1 predicted protein [Naegleria gruberi]|eukprot:XP_002675919.1 predicted protein [Naegleria gruberi strain NEG-M]
MTSRNLSFKLLIVLLCSILIANSIYCKSYNPFTKPRAKRLSSLPSTVSGRKVYGFGSNAAGQLGQENYYIPQAIDTFKGKNVSFVCAQQDDSGSNVRVFFVVSETTGESKLYGMGSSTNTLSSTVNYLLGLNTTSSFTVPQLIASYSVGIKSLACGTEHVIYLLNNGNSDLYGFGNNNYQQLGKGFDYLVAPTNLTIMDSVPTLKLAKVFAFGYSSFGIQISTNLLYGWGDNAFQKMGITDYIVQAPTLLGTSYYTTVQKVVGYSRSMFVLTTDGKLFAGGSNDEGVLGINGTSITQQATPVQVQLNGETVLDISVYKLGALASTNQNKVYFWGKNDMASFCTSTTSSYYPVQVSSALFSPSLSTTITQITTAYQHSVLLTSSGDVYVCGDNSEGQLGLNPWSSSVTGAVKSSTTVPSGKTASYILAVSSKNTFVLTTDNGVYSMGKISTTGDQVYYTSPTVLSTIASNVQFDHVYASNGVSFATEYLTGKTWAWGSNRSPYNFLNPNIYIDQQVPRAIPELNSYNVTGISIGYGTYSSKVQTTVFFMTNVSTLVLAMGSNSNGQMGLGTGTSTSNVTLIPRTIQYENGTIVIESVSCGAIHTIMKARRTTATTMSLFVMGGNSRGQIANVEKEAPIRLSTNTVVMAAAGPFHSTYVSYESKGGSGTTRTYFNRVYGTGDSTYGQLGFGALTASSSFREIGNVNSNSNSNSVGTFTNITTITNIITSADSTFIVTSVGVYVVGDNTYGQLGLDPNLNGSRITTPVLNPSIPITAVKIVISQPDGYYAGFLTASGAVYMFGLNDKGQLGLGHQNNVYTPTKVPIPNGELAIDVALGTEHSLIITGTKPCPGDCNYKGTCDPVTGFCTCEDSFTGFDCDLYNCVDPKCNGHGTCDTSIGICTCDDSYSGVSCERRKCPNDCNGNGLCSSEGVCQCFTGYTQKIDCATPDAGLKSFDAKSIVTLILIALSVVLLFTNRN